MTTMATQLDQRFSDWWRTRLGSAALSVVNAFFDSDSSLRDSNEARQKWAIWALKDGRFLYSSAQSKNTEVCHRSHHYTMQLNAHGAFRNGMVYFMVPSS
jgi:hypothetical protein